MNNFKEYISEKLRINKDIEVVTEDNRDASKGASINMDLDNTYVFMMYDENSGIISCFSCDSPQQLAKDSGMELKDTKRLCYMNKGQSYYNNDTNTIITLIS